MLENKRIAEIVTENYSSATIFMKYGIDFCCGGGVTLQKACESKNLSVSEIEKELIEQQKTQETPVEFPTLHACIDYILEKHHVFELNLIQSLNEMLNKLILVHSQTHPEVLQYKKLFKALEEELITHFPKEENILFPSIKAMENNTPLPFPNDHILHPVAVMEREHEEVGKILWEIIEFTSKFTPPEYACNTWRAFLANWKTLVEDIQKHVFLENEILFPKLRNFLQAKKI